MLENDEYNYYVTHDNLVGIIKYTGTKGTLTIDQIDGKDVYKSFTAPTKKEAEFNANQFLIKSNKNKIRRSNEYTFADALENYINLKETVLSPSTIRGYKSLKRNFIEKFPKFFLLIRELLRIIYSIKVP